MPDWEAVTVFVERVGIAGTMLFFVGLFMWRYGQRYIASVEKLHDSLGERMGTQQGLCALHGKRIEGHDVAMRKAALQGCEMCRAVADREFPNSAALVGKHCDEIERIIGEA